MAQVLQILQKAHLKIRIDKCQFAWTSVDHLITPNGTVPNKSNIEAVTFFPRPAKKKTFVPSLAYVPTINNLSRTAQFFLDSYSNY